MVRSLAQDALLACIDERTGRLHPSFDILVRTAPVLRLYHDGRVSLSDSERWLRVRVIDDRATGDPDLDAVLADLGRHRRGRRVGDQLSHSSRARDLLARLIDQELIAVERQRRVLGRSEVVHRPHPRLGADRLRAELRSVLAGEPPRDEHTVLLVALLTCVPGPRVRVDGHRAGQVRRRAAEVTALLHDGEREILQAAARRHYQESGSD